MVTKDSGKTDGWLEQNFADELKVLRSYQPDLEGLPDEALVRWLMAKTFANEGSLSEVTSLFGLIKTSETRKRITVVLNELHRNRIAKK